MFSRISLALIAVSILVGCGGTYGKWDLSKPIYVDIDTRLTSEPLFLSGMKTAISSMGGHPSDNKAEPQIITVRSINGGTCARPNITAYTTTPNIDAVFICYDLASRTVYDQHMANHLMAHELLHALSDRGDHLPCDTHAVMIFDPDCKPGTPHAELPTPLDIAYGCSTGHAINGICGR